ncbi:MAG: hypothetical protein AAF497_16690, partial [Planctomycetota bacterium]
MDELQALQEQRNTLAKQIRDQADIFNADKYNGQSKDKKTWPNAEERQKFDTLNSDYNEVEAKLTEARNAQAVADTLQGLDEYENSAPAPSANTPGLENASSRQTEDTDVENRHMALSFDAWNRRSRNLPLTEEHRDACRVTGVNPNIKEIQLTLESRVNNEPCWT